MPFVYEFINVKDFKVEKKYSQYFVSTCIIKYFNFILQLESLKKITIYNLV